MIAGSRARTGGHRVNGSQNGATKPTEQTDLGSRDCAARPIGSAGRPAAARPARWSLARSRQTSSRKIT